MSQTPSSGQHTTRFRSRPGLQRLAGGLAALVAVTATTTSLPTTATAVEPIVSKGDILVAAQGDGLFTPGRVDKINPSTGAAAVASAFATDDDPDAIAALPGGDIVVGLRHGRLVRVDHLTGAQRTIRLASGDVPWADLAADAHGNLFALLRENTRTALV
jgi:hypothetical protein